MTTGAPHFTRARATRWLFTPFVVLLVVSIWWLPAAWIAGVWLAIPFSARRRVNQNRWR